MLYSRQEISSKIEGNEDDQGGESRRNKGWYYLRCLFYRGGNTGPGFKVFGENDAGIDDHACTNCNTGEGEMIEAYMQHREKCSREQYNTGQGQGDQDDLPDIPQEEGKKKDNYQHSERNGSENFE